MTATAPLDAAEAMRGAGLRVTESRTAVYSALLDQPHASADAIFAAIAADLPRTSLQSVYNALGDFADAGIVRRIEPAGQSMLFELRTGDNHHHLVCTSCGAVEDVDCAVGHAPCLTPSHAHGFTISTAEVTYWGLCPACAAAAA
ncbi:MAG: transcriptional repressor [Microbacterium sp. SCN 70-200]|uniref:Fur family transcriptional regulator n=1 Tax=unclassified Microbacterium TaxID=2609290 RepID=UPI00086C2079|nr:MULTISPECIES: Fur family transcriptional regulator [unclassified Microbacterium]MBN9213880.1 transcriptional repressor [Microbacterium sp.]ODT42514.1 MAG: transcriptional repressor [Microbacterium sp. SCN 70-200]OJV85564.1 MAG: transcriptional repressor [Microbacterium sp. 70-16]